jgi:hypothetical protein
MVSLVIGRFAGNEMQIQGKAPQEDADIFLND